MKKIISAFLFVLYQFSLAQTDQVNSNAPLVKDPYFQKNKAQLSTPTQKVKHLHSDQFQRLEKMFGGNPFFTGSVQFEHQGSNLSADTVVFYQKENFVKAIGNVVLLTSDGNKITSKTMEYDGNTQRGIAHGNVVLTDPKQTITTETLYYDRIPNTAYFNSGGTIFDGKNTIVTKTATYDLNSKMIDLDGNVNIDNQDYRVEGTKIKQNSNTNTADFSGSTYIINKKNPSNYVFTKKGRYNMNTKEVYLQKDSRVHYNGKILTGDDMYYNQITGFAKAKGNVMLNDPKENRYIKGGYGEIFEKKDSAMITEKPYAVKILKKDSLYFSAEKILAYQKMDSSKVKKSFLRAFNKARFFKSNAQARADSLSFNETDGIMHLSRKPILWSGEKQVTGDTIRAYFNTKEENIDSLKVIGNAFAISKADSLNRKDEFNQIKGKLMNVYYKNGEINFANAIGNAQSITYADDENKKTKKTERVGIALTSCGELSALFEERRIQIIECNIGANSEMYPMSRIEPEKRKFKDFNWNTKDRLQKWRDIFLDTPNYEEKKYETDTSLFDKAQELRKKEEAKNKPKSVKRERKL